MSMCCCETKCRCILLSLVAGVILGVVAAFLQITGMITVTPAFLWVVLGIAVVYLAVFVIAGALQNRQGAGSASAIRWIRFWRGFWEAPSLR